MDYTCGHIEKTTRIPPSSNHHISSSPTTQQFSQSLPLLIKSGIQRSSQARYIPAEWGDLTEAFPTVNDFSLRTARALRTDGLYANPPTKIDGSPDLPRCNLPLLSSYNTLNPAGADNGWSRNGRRPRRRATRRPRSGVAAAQQQPLRSPAALDVLSHGRGALFSSTIHPHQTGQSRVQVLLQILNSPESAGSNLTIANHIIFVGPYFTREHVFIPHDEQLDDSFGPWAAGPASNGRFPVRTWARPGSRYVLDHRSQGIPG
ncbi:hypothetical protein IMZ48_01670 [Candidatus Bathyarchaeota archaeon]|nr:hypothetical protein [Candidatus Bathyarchaeota archaeon]